MKIAIATAFIAALWVTAPVTQASAGTTCTKVGNTTYCTSTDGRRTTCTKVGNTTYCN